MAMKGNHIPAGGPASNKVVRPGYKQGQDRERANKTGTAQLGQKQGSHFTAGGHGGRTHSGYGGVPIFDGGAASNTTELGNANALKGGDAKGKARTVYKTGSQGC
jgi:hypothetical protein